LHFTWELHSNAHKAQTIIQSPPHYQITETVQCIGYMGYAPYKELKFMEIRGANGLHAGEKILYYTLHILLFHFCSLLFLSLQTRIYFPSWKSY